MLIAALFTIPLQYPRYESNLMSFMDEWMKKNVCVYNSSLKRKETKSFEKIWMNLEDIMLTEISQTQKEGKKKKKPGMISIKCATNKKSITQK